MSLESRITALAEAVGTDIKSLRPEINPVLTYDGAGKLTRVDYTGGNHKTFSYTNSVLTQMVYVQGLKTITKNFYYNTDGTLASVSQVVI